MTYEKWIQSRLTSHGFPVGEMTGRFDQVTIAALKAFQKATGLPVTGEMSETVRNALRAIPQPASPAEMAAIPDRDEDEGPDTGVFSAVKNIWPRQSEVPSYYGARGANQTRVEVPWDLVLAWDKTVRVKAITLHKKVAASAERTLHAIDRAYSAQEKRDLGLNIFGGSLNVRRMRGGKNWSMHSWGIAIDWDPTRNMLSVHKPKARLSHADALDFWLAWEAEGWVSLGRSRDYDWMHVQAARL